jgi:hypothetical protein
MVTPSTSKKQRKSHSDWSFIPSILAGTTGVVIGLVIANFLGWV